MFSRGKERHRAHAPTVEAWSDDDGLSVAVRNNDTETAVSPHLVLRIASTETSEYDRAEVELGSIDPDGRVVASVATSRQSVFRVWWFLTWEAAGEGQHAAGNVDVT